MFYDTEFLSEIQFQQIAGLFTEEEVAKLQKKIINYLREESLLTPLMSYTIAKYSMYKGVEIASEETFFNYFQEEQEISHPGTLFWRAYDALNRGQIDQFIGLWNRYCDIDFQKFEPPFLFEAFVIPEDPLFILVEKEIYQRQNAFVKWIEKTFLDNRKTNTTDEKILDKDTKNSELTVFLGPFSHLLAFFRMEQAQFSRFFPIQDFQSTETIFTDQIIKDLGPYWELVLLLKLTKWRLHFSLIYEAIESVALAKHLNSIASNQGFDSIIFQIEAQIASSQDNSQEAIELLRSAEFLAKQQHNEIMKINILDLKAQFDAKKSLDYFNNWLITAQNHKLVWLEAKALKNIADFYIKKKEWTQAESCITRAINIFNRSIDQYGYVEALADYCYLLIAIKNYEKCLEFSEIITETERPLIIQLRGVYLQAVSLLHMKFFKEAIELLEEAIRQAMHSPQSFQLPWFYELLGIIYISNSDWEIASNYFNLASRAYFDLSHLEEGYSANLIQIYAIALMDDYGKAFLLLQNLFANEITNVDILQEVLWANQSIILLSKEPIQQMKWNNLWKTKIEADQTNSESNLINENLNKLYWNRVEKKWDIHEAERRILSLCSNLNPHKPDFWNRELILWIIYEYILKIEQPDRLKQIIKCLQKTYPEYSLPYSIEESLKNAILNLGRLDDVNVSDLQSQLKAIRSVLVKNALVASIRRIIRSNIPYDLSIV
ncbi:MAG: hypothetical protein ACXAC7_02925 [Candidatus Hodarchaeales archaeon]|jgi:tetratricopeptide (TPR) repeat protein